MKRWLWFLWLGLAVLVVFVAPLDTSVVQDVFAQQRPVTPP